MKYSIRLDGSGNPLTVECDRIVPNHEAGLLFFLFTPEGGREGVKAIVPLRELKLVRRLTDSEDPPIDEEPESTQRPFVR